MRSSFYILFLVVCFQLLPLFAQSTVSKAPSTPGDTLVVLWSSGDPAVAEKVCLMYTHAAGKFHWFNQVTLIVWGPSAKLLAENEALQTKVKSMIADGIRVEACVMCADSYGVSDKLRELGIHVYGMGKPLTSYLKKRYSLLTF